MERAASALIAQAARITSTALKQSDSEHAVLAVQRPISHSEPPRASRHAKRKRKAIVAQLLRAHASTMERMEVMRRVASDKSNQS
jgi:hypothetical protein